MTNKKCHCEVVVLPPKQSQKTLTQEYRIASLRSQRRRTPSDCFGPSTLAMTDEERHCEVVVSLSLFVTASS